MRKCTICHHEQKQLIEDCLIAIGSHRQIAQAFGLSKDAVRRHAMNHLPVDHPITHTRYEIDLAVRGKEYADRWERIRQLLEEPQPRQITPIWHGVTQKGTHPRKHPVCRCPAYGFPHRQNSGFCRFPFEPLKIWQGEAGKPSAANLRRRQANAFWRRNGESIKYILSIA